jgi:hypothetical protein
LNGKKHAKDAARELVEMLFELDVWHRSSIANVRDRLQYIELNVTSKCGLFVRALRPLTSILCVDSIISQREHEQRLWKIPEVELGDASEIDFRGTNVLMVSIIDL